MKKIHSALAIAATASILALTACTVPADEPDDPASTSPANDVVSESPEATTEPTEAPGEGERFTFSEDQELTEEGNTVPGTSQPTSVDIVLPSTIVGLDGEEGDKVVSVAYSYVDVREGDSADWADIVDPSSKELLETHRPVYIEYSFFAEDLGDGEILSQLSNVSAVDSAGNDGSALMISHSNEEARETWISNEMCPPFPIVGDDGVDTYCSVSFVPNDEEVAAVAFYGTWVEEGSPYSEKPVAWVLD